MGAEGFVGLPADGTGKKLRTYDKGTAGHDQFVIPTTERTLTYRGRANSFATLGIAGTTGHKLMTLHNASGSSVLVDVQRVWTDVMQTAARVVEQAKIRVHRITALPAGGTAFPKVAMDSAQTSSSSVTLLQSTASDTGTATAITATIPANSVLVQEWAPRALTMTGYEQYDRSVYFEGDPVRLRASEGICLELVYTVATASPTTDKWLYGVEWDEFTL